MYTLLVMSAISINAYYLPELYLVLKDKKKFDLRHLVPLILFIAINFTSFYYLSFKNFSKIILLGVMVSGIAIYSGLKLRR